MRRLLRSVVCFAWSLFAPALAELRAAPGGYFFEQTRIQLIFSSFISYPFPYLTSQDSSSRSLPRMVLRGITVVVDSPISVPVYLENTPNAKLQKAVFEVAYPVDTFSFERAESGVLLQSSEFKVEAESSATPENGKEKVRLTISSTREASFIPDGLLVYLRFNAHPKEIEKLAGMQQPNGTPGLEVIHVDLEFLEAQTVTGDQLSRTELEADRGLGITVLSTMPFSSCFFYMH